MFENRVSFLGFYDFFYCERENFILFATICLGPTGNFQGSYHFLNLVSGLVIKRRAFHELPAPDSIIDHVMALAATSGVSSDLIFAYRHQVPFSWSNNDVDPPPVQPVAPYPNVSAEFLGVTLERHIEIVFYFYAFSDNVEEGIEEAAEAERIQMEGYTP